MSASDLGLRPTTEPHAAGSADARGRSGDRERRRRLLVTIGLAAAAALLAAWQTPRGPITTLDALLWMAGGAGLGLAAGAVLRTRWSMAVTPAVFVVVFELARLGERGPTVDASWLGSLAGLAIFVAIRVLLGVLVLVPMALGARWGVDLAARRGAPPARRLRRLGRVALIVGTAALAVLAGVIARPASTAPILGPDGTPVPGSIAELTTLSLRGRDQALMIRGLSTDNPVLLHLAGGPGGTDIGAMRLDPALERDFVVVTWDQPGTGKSYGALEPTLTPQQVADDTLAVTDYLRERFGEERIFLTGQSWGTLPAVLAAQHAPERYHAFVGTGQMVDIAETDRMFYDDTLAWATARGNTDLVARLQTIGPPPYAELSNYLTIVGTERDLNPYPEFDGHTEMPATVWVPENSFMDRINAFRGLVDTYAVLYPQLQGIDLRERVTRLDVPIVVVVGEHEARGRVEPAREWLEALDAPTKEWVELADSSHRASFEQPAAYAAVLDRVRQAALLP